MDAPLSISANQLIVLKITALEATQARPLRELALGDTTARARVQTIQDQIAALRAKLTPEN